MTRDTYKKKLEANTVHFEDTMAVIDAYFDFFPTAFKNGETFNKEGENNGSCKLFAFAKKEGYSEQQTLQAFGDFYRKDVLEHPNEANHANIRNFIKFGWGGIAFDGEPLKLK